MAGAKRSASPMRAALIGDVVGSRQASDRGRLHRRITQILAGTPLAFTVGDEFHGSYPTVGDAIDAALAVRLALAPDVDIRFGIGWGEVTMLDAGTGIQDGPGWWSARDAAVGCADIVRRLPIHRRWTASASYLGHHENECRDPVGVRARLERRGSRTRSAQGR